MADLQQYVPAKDVPALLRQRFGRSYHYKTIARWMRKGVAGPDGHRVVLPSIRVGRYRFVSAEALDEFCEELARAWSSSGSRKPARLAPRQMRSSSSRKLDEDGF